MIMRHTVNEWSIFYIVLNIKRTGLQGALCETKRSDKSVSQSTVCITPVAVM